jgi:hypothetical protein
MLLTMLICKITYMYNELHHNGTCLEIVLEVTANSIADNFRSPIQSRSGVPSIVSPIQSRLHKTTRILLEGN